MKTYSIYEAKSKLSELLRLARTGTDVVITDRGRPVARVSAFQEKVTNLAERMEELRRAGRVGTRTRKALPEHKEKRVGSLKRFLQSR